MIVSELSNILFQIPENCCAISQLSVVMGAIGGQGGFVVHAMLADSNYRIVEIPLNLGCRPPICKFHLCHHRLPCGVVLGLLPV